MIENINDILKILKETKENNKTVIRLILRYDNMTGLLYETLEMGYTPEIKYQVGKLSNVNLKLGKVLFLVKSQTLAPAEGDGNIVVETENKYNKMNEAMNEFNKALFKNNHKSFYTNQDVDILDCYRTIVPSGIFWRSDSSECSEIDISKAFTSALKTINKIPKIGRAHV